MNAVDAVRQSERPRWESPLIFALSYVFYAALGVWVVVELNVVVLDALSRLAHGYFAFHNDPPKLAAIGFEWPPLMTLVVLPLSAIKPLATSYAALPLTSAVFGAGMLVVLNSTLRMLEMRPPMRYVLVALFGLNPLIAFYATNGMGEATYLFLLVLGLHFFVRWYLDGGTHHLGIAGIAMALGTLSRYEVGIFALAMAVAVLIVLAARRAQRDEVDGSLTLFGAPLIYGVGAWLLFNWLIVGDALFWLKRQAEGNVSVGRGTADAAEVSAIPVAEIVADVVNVNLLVFPLTFVVALALVAAAVLRRNLMAALLAAFVSLNAFLTALFIYMARDPTLLQLRYNMRAMPIAVIGIGWLFYMARGRSQRLGVWAVAAVALAVTIPLTWSTMSSYQFQFQESAFTAALETREDQEGTLSVGDYTIGTKDHREAAEAVTAITNDRASVLTDDATQTHAVMLLSDEPEIFVDRSSLSDELWLPIVLEPWDRVDYVLVPNEGVASVLPGRIRECWPAIIDRGAPGGLRSVFENASFVLLAVPEEIPASAERFEPDPECAAG